MTWPWWVVVSWCLLGLPTAILIGRCIKERPRQRHDAFCGLTVEGTVRCEVLGRCNRG